jgi:hypothetical protein
VKTPQERQQLQVLLGRQRAFRAVALRVCNRKVGQRVPAASRDRLFVVYLEVPRHRLPAVGALHGGAGQLQQLGHAVGQRHAVGACAAAVLGQSAAAPLAKRVGL